MKYLTPVAICFLSIASCNNMDDPAPKAMDTKENTEPPATGEVTKAGVFTSYQHNLMGSASLYTDSTSTSIKVLRLENFTMTQGPDVRVYISKSNNYSKANVLEVTTLTSGYNNQAFNFEITSPSYSEEHKFVLVYCLQYNSLFGYAELK